MPSDGGSELRVERGFRGQIEAQTWRTGGPIGFDHVKEAAFGRQARHYSGIAIPFARGGKFVNTGRIQRPPGTDPTAGRVGDSAGHYPAALRETRVEGPACPAPRVG